jgi:hypothetical protein
MVIVLKKRYSGYFIFALIVIVFGLILSSSGTSVTILDSPCNSDCTMSDNICHEECDNVNECNYPSGDKYIGFDPLIGTSKPLTIKEICNLQKIGWVKPFNSTHNVICCNSNPVPKLTRTKLSISVDPSVKNIATLSRYVSYNGKIVTMYISVWE